VFAEYVRDGVLVEEVWDDSIAGAGRFVVVMTDPAAVNAPARALSSTTCARGGA
jgi:hypothetical protein